MYVVPGIITPQIFRIVTDLFVPRLDTVLNPVGFLFHGVSVFSARCRAFDFW